MKRIIRIVPSMVAFVVLLLGCKESIDRYESPKPKESTPPVADIQLPSHWIEQTNSKKDIDFRVYKSEGLVSNRKTRLVALVIDPKKVDFKPVQSTSAKTVSQFYQSEQDVLAAVNGGFFGTGTSYSLVVQSGVNLADNIRSLSRSYNNVSTTYYPTRAAFGLSAQNSPSVAWVYSINSAKGPIYSYPNPSPNKEGQAPQAQPTASFPVGGQLWSVHNAIGGSPMLIKNKKINITDSEELISIDNNSSRARTAIGYLESGRVVLVVAEGGNSAESIAGLNLSELANLMLEMGCVGAVNLDGGGSTMMVINGDKQIRASDAAGERAVISAVLIKKKV